MQRRDFARILHEKTGSTEKTKAAGHGAPYFEKVINNREFPGGGELRYREIGKKNYLCSTGPKGACNRIKRKA